MTAGRVGGICPPVRGSGIYPLAACAGIEIDMTDDSFRDFVLDQLGPLGAVRSRGMFGGHGLYLDEIFFGIIFRGRLFFRTDEASRAEYLERGMSPFEPNEKQTLRRYFEVPVSILEDPEAVIEWAQRAAEARGS